MGTSSSHSAACDGLTRDLKGRRYVLDGEIVCLDSEGKPQFCDLLSTIEAPKYLKYCIATLVSIWQSVQNQASWNQAMEPVSTTIISVGANAELVRLRNFVLQEAGFNVVSTLDEHDALARIERGECGVSLVCYSVGKAVRQRLAETFRKFCPDSRIVAITNEHMDKADFADTF